ncbi:hypothetical protein ACT4ML_00470 [Natrinema sp. LN54]|uniref:hypothetical protein n=1 Tax=Natrinema sp. LN54 TaxID=3458705 RepID=UPI004034F8A1
MTQPASTRDDGAPTRRKATLFCWECDHASPIDGDWQVQPRPRHVAYVCPSCETTLAKRPRRTDPSPARAPTPLAVWRRTLRTSATVWRASIDIGISSLTAAAAVGAVSGRAFEMS